MVASGFIMRVQQTIAYDVQATCGLTCRWKGWTALSQSLSWLWRIVASCLSTAGSWEVWVLHLAVPQPYSVLSGLCFCCCSNQGGTGVGLCSRRAFPHSVLPWETLTWCRGTELVLRAAMSLPVCLSGQTA